MLAFPRSFRREFGEEFVRSVADLGRHGGVGPVRLAALVGLDVLRSAPKLRLESVMSSRHRTPMVVAALLSLAVFAAAVGSPVVLLLIAAVVGLAVVVARSGRRPVAADPTEPARWSRYVLAGAAAGAVGFATLAIDGPELSSVGWTITMLGWASGVVLAIFGLALAVIRPTARRA